MRCLQVQRTNNEYWWQWCSKYPRVDSGPLLKQMDSKYFEYCLQWPTVYAPSQWETALYCTAISHWLGVYAGWSLCLHATPYGYPCTQLLCMKIQSSTDLLKSISNVSRLTITYALNAKYMTSTVSMRCFPRKQITSIDILWRYYDMELDLITVDEIYSCLGSWSLKGFI